MARLLSIDPERLVEGNGAVVYRVEHSPSGYVYVGSSNKFSDRPFLRMLSLHRFSLRPDYYRALPEPWKVLGWSRRFFDVASMLSYEGWRQVEVRHFPAGSLLIDVADAEAAEIQRCVGVDPSLVLNVQLQGGVPRYLHASYERVEDHTLFGIEGARSVPASFSSSAPVAVQADLFLPSRSPPKARLVRDHSWEHWPEVPAAEVERVRKDTLLMFFQLMDAPGALGESASLWFDAALRDWHAAPVSEVPL